MCRAAAIVVLCSVASEAHFTDKLGARADIPDAFLKQQLDSTMLNKPGVSGAALSSNLPLNLQQNQHLKTAVDGVHRIMKDKNARDQVMRQAAAFHQAATQVVAPVAATVGTVCEGCATLKVMRHLRGNVAFSRQAPSFGMSSVLVVAMISFFLGSRVMVSRLRSCCQEQTTGSKQALLL